MPSSSCACATDSKETNCTANSVTAIIFSLRFKEIIVEFHRTVSAFWFEKEKRALTAQTQPTKPNSTNNAKFARSAAICGAFFYISFFFSFFQFHFFLLADVLFCRMLRLLRLQLNASLISCLTRTKHFCLARIKR